MRRYLLIDDILKPKRGTVIEIPQGAPGTYYDAIYEAFGGEYPAMLGLHESDKACGVYYDWGLANRDGASYNVLPLPENTPEQVKACTAYIRRHFDVVSLRVIKPKKWVSFTMPAQP